MYNNKLKAEVIIGALLRGQFRRELEKIKFTLPKEYSLDYKEEKGFIDSAFFITAKGTENFVKTLANWLKELTEEYGD